MCGPVYPAHSRHVLRDNAGFFSHHYYGLGQGQKQPEGLLSINVCSTNYNPIRGYPAHSSLRISARPGQLGRLSSNEFRRTVSTQILTLIRTLTAYPDPMSNANLNRNSKLRPVYTEHDHKRERGHCDFPRAFPQESWHEPPLTIHTERGNSGSDSSNVFCCAPSHDNCSKRLRHRFW